MNGSGTGRRGAGRNGSGAELVGLPGGTLASWSGFAAAQGALALALTRTAARARLAMQDRMRAVLHDPKTYTLRSVRYAAARPGALAARVYIDDFAGKSVPPAKYLAALERGGLRRFKKFEKALQASGVLEPHEWALPADGGSIDLAMSGGRGVGGLYTRLLSGLRANPDAMSSTTARSAKRRPRRPRYFRSGRFVWERLGPDQVRPVLIVLSRAPGYRPILGFAATVERKAVAEIGRQWRRAWLDRARD